MPKSWRVVCVFSIFIAACSPNNVTIDNSLSKYFEARNVTGCFSLFDNGQGHFSIYNLPRFRDSAYSPGATFNIVNSLIGIQTGRVQDSSSVISGDSVGGANNLTMMQAFQASNTGWFQQLSRRIGKDTMQKWVDTLGYAAVTAKGRAVINQPDSFWLDNSMKITGDEQLGLMKKLYFEQLPFYNRTQKIVKRMMIREDNSNYVMGYQTGTARVENGHSVGWLVGWIEENKHAYLFLLEVESPKPDFALQEPGLAILKDILKQYGFMEGNK